ncbi:copia protein [Tanacetum coccineum]
MQRPPLFEANCFIYWKNHFETYVKSKDIDLWHIIVHGNYKPTIQKEGKVEIIPYEKYKESHKKMISKNDEAKMVLYNALPKKEYERIFMCDTAKDIWNSLIITHQGNKQVKDNKIDLFVQKYEEFTIFDDETIDCAFARFNTIITSLKALDESFSSHNHVKKYFRALPTKWRPNVTAIEEPKDLSTRRAYRQSKILSEEEASTSDSEDEEYAMVVRDFKKFFRIRGKFVRQPHDDKKNFQKIKEEKKEKEDRSDSEDDSKKEEICLMTLDNNEVLSDTLYCSSSSLDNESLQNEYDKLCKISLRIINKNKHLKAKNEVLKNKTCDLRKRVKQLERNKEISLECESCVNLQSKIGSLTLKLASFKSSISSLQEMLEMKKPPKDKHRIEYTEDIASTSNVKTKRLCPKDDKMPTIEPESPVPSTRESASSVEQNRLFADSTETLEPNIVRLKVKLEPDEWIKDSGCSRHIRTISPNLTPNLSRGIFLGYSPNSKAYVILNKETMRVEESLNVRFDESPPPKSSPLVDDDIIENQTIENQIQDIEIKENKPSNKEIINIKETKDHPIDSVIDENGVVSRNKARLVAQGYNQQEGIDFDETYAPVALLESIRILLAYACAHDFKLFQMDVKIAFLNSFINEEVYVAQPPSFVDFEKPNHVFKLKKALYGLKQAPKACYDRLKAFLLDHMYTMGLGTRVETIVYADSDHAGDYVDRKSTSSVCTFMGCCLTSWFSKKQTALAISTTEAKYVSARKACQQALWMKQALFDYDIILDDIPVLCDNKGAIDLIKNPVLHSRTKHIEIRHHFLRDNVQKGNISIEKVSYEDNIADILTKPLKREPFNLLRLGLGLASNLVALATLHPLSPPYQALSPPTDYQTALSSSPNVSPPLSPITTLGISPSELLLTPKSSPPPLTSPPPAPTQPSKHSSPLSINLDPVELIFSTPPTSLHALFDSLEDLPPRITNPPPPRPSFESIECLANQPPPLPTMKPPLPPFPPKLSSLLPPPPTLTPPLSNFPLLQPFGPNNPFLMLTHEMFCNHCQRTQRSVPSTIKAGSIRGTDPSRGQDYPDLVTGFVVTALRVNRDALSTFYENSIFIFDEKFLALILVTDIQKRTKTKPKRTKPSTGLEERGKTKLRAYFILNGPTCTRFVEKGYAGNPEGYDWSKNVEVIQGLKQMDLESRDKMKA